MSLLAETIILLLLLKSILITGNFLSNGLDGEEVQSILAFDTARDQMKQAIANQLSTKDTTVSGGSSYFGDGSPAIGNSETYSCSDVQASIDNSLVLQQRRWFF